MGTWSMVVYGGEEEYRAEEEYDVEQGSPNYGPRATSGPPHNFIRPSKQIPVWWP